MRTLIFGGAGMLGKALVAEARSRGFAALALPRGQADVRDRERLLYWADTFRPELVVNCAAYTRVDDCESDPEAAAELNGRAVAHVAEAARRAGARLIQISTDYVFDGRASAPYAEDAETAPLSVYGRSKLEGERRALALPRALVVRTSWLFGPGGANFVATIVGKMAAGERRLQVVEDQVGCPTYTPFLARAVLDLAPLDLDGVVHYRNREPVSWYAFADEIARLWASDVEVVPVTTAQFPRPAPRPAYSVLDVARFERALTRRVEPWGWGLVEYLAAIRRSRG
ncbi:MAG TPA: dTDP-4-dehydrorhamnose reductase [Thermoanaerobaculia bacterium]|nr:dTDP-4-dehydrorhamnose reductase [Thermoanaerobaculia bacterium]